MNRIYNPNEPEYNPNELEYNPNELEYNPNEPYTNFSPRRVYLGFQYFA